MADDGVIRIGTQVDISGIQAGMKSAQAAVTESTSEMQSAYQRLAGSTAEYAVSQANLRAVIAQVVSGQVPYKIATEALTPALMEQTAAANALKAAKAALAATESEETAVVRGNMSARMAASAEMRVLEGNIQGSTRAAAAFLTTIPGVGEAMQAAFSVFGAVALAGVIVDVGQKFYTAFDIGGERARKTQQDIAAVTNEIERSTTSLDVQIDKLQQEQAKLEHKPFNGIKLVLDEAAESAQKLAEQLDRVAEREKTVIAGMSASMPQRILGGAQTGYEQSMLTEHAKWIAQAKTQQDQLNESVSYGNSLQIRLNDLKARQAASDAAALGSGGETGIVADYSREIQAVQQMISWQQQEQGQIKATIALNQQQAATQGARDTHGASSIADSAARKAAAAKRAADEAAIQADRRYADEMKSTHAVTAEDEAQYWEGIALQATQGSKEYATAVDEANKALGRYQTQTQELSQRVGQELQQTWDAAQKAADEATKKQDQLANDVAASGERMKAAQQGAANAVAEANLRAGEASGGIGRVAAAQEQARLHAQAYREELERLDAAITRVNSDEALTPQQRSQQNGQLQAQKVQVQGQMGAAAISDQSNIQQQIAQPWMSAFDQIDQSWLQVQNRMMFSTRNLGLEFAKMGQQIFISVVDNAEKAALQYGEKKLMELAIHHMVESAKVASTTTANATMAASDQATSNSSILGQLMSLIFHHSAQAQKVAATTASNATQTATTVTANIASAQSYAAVAAVAAMASAAAIPVVGWVMAPEAGAATYAAAQGFAAMAAFETGTGYVPRDGMAYLHEGEAVVPAPTMDQLRGSEGGGGDVNITQHNSWNAGSNREFQRQLQQNASHVAAAVQKHMRQGGRG
jgi:hypothetical protein